MATEESQDGLVPERLEALGLALLSEWDAFAFLYRHPASLGTAADIARLTGHDKAEIGAAIHRLEDLGLIHRSRDSQGIRLYQLSVPTEPGLYSSLMGLMELAQNRAGRLLMLKHLKSPRNGPRRTHDRGLHLA